MNRRQARERQDQLAKLLGNTPADKLAGEIGNTYVQDHERFVVSLLVGYAEDDAATPVEAARLALDLTRDEGSCGTNWYVYDRLTGELHLLEQRAFDGEPLDG